jgi:ribose transport system permease protein
MSQLTSQPAVKANPFQFDRAFIVVMLTLVVLLAANFILFPQRLSIGYGVQQLQIASFLGILAGGAMIVLLIGEIDLSVPWVLALAAMIASGLASAYPDLPQIVPILVAVAFGALCGLWNGLGVAILRAPSMVWTLGLNALLLGVSVFYAGGYSPQTAASPLMRYLAVGRIGDVIPVVVILWVVVSIGIVVMLRATAFGASLYAVGRNEAVAYLAGIRTRFVKVMAFVLAGCCSALAGVLLAGYSGQAYQSMGDSYLLPTIAAVVLGGTHVQGGQGRYAGTVGGVMVLVILGSLLALLQAPEFIRQITYGTIIVGMLLIAQRR